MKTVSFRWAAPVSVLFLLVFSGLARAAEINEDEDFGDIRASAFALDGLMLAANNLKDDKVYGVGDPTASVRGRISRLNEVDFFSFEGNGGESFVFDVDTDKIPQALPDSFLSLFDESGTLLAKGDEISGDVPDLGSKGTVDAFIGVFTLPGAATERRRYYLAITDFGNRATAEPGLIGTQLVRPVSALDEQDGEGHDRDNFNLGVVGAAAGVDTFVGQSSPQAGRGSYLLHITRMLPVVAPIAPQLKANVTEK